MIIKLGLPALSGKPAPRAFAANEGGEGLVEGGVAANPDPAVGQLVNEQLHKISLGHADKGAQQRVVEPAER